MQIDPLSDSQRLKNQTAAAGLNVKLSRTSSARPLLYSKTSNEMLNRLAVIIQDSKNIHDISTKGKLPVEAAYTVMKRVTEAAGEPLIPTGLSTFNKLQSLRTDPALKVLKSHTWKGFFTSSANEHSPDQKGRRPSTANGRFTGTNPGGDTGSNGGGSGGRHRKSSKDQQSIAAHQQAAVLERVFANLILRIEDLWDQMRIPPQERQFYHKTAFKVPVDSYEPCKNLAVYVEMLELHKELTKDVIFAIHAREEAVKKCYDTLSAIRRKLQRANLLSGAAPSSGGNNNNSNGAQQQRPASASMRPASSTPSLTEAQIVDEAGRMAFWKEELIVSLDEVRCTSLEVIKTIQQWRRILWRPHAFVWCGINYLYKMQEDMNILESDMYLRILSLVPLTRDDILCVIFSPAANTTIGGEPIAANQNAKDPTSNSGNKSPTSRMSVSSTSNSPSRSNSQSPTRPVRRGSNNARPGTATSRQRQQQYEKIDATLRSLLEAFRENIDLPELHAAARVVIDEYKLQQAIATEKDALHFKGVFIPLLKARKDLREDDLAFYYHQHPKDDSASSKNNTSKSNQNNNDNEPSERSTQRPFSPPSNNNHNNNTSNSKRPSAAYQEEIDGGGGDFHNHDEELYDGNARHFHFNSMHLEPPANNSDNRNGGSNNDSNNAAGADRYYQADFYDDN